MDNFTKQAVAAITEDNVSGAVEIAEKAAAVLTRLARSTEAVDQGWLRQAVIEAGWALIRAHPTMAPLVNLINEALWAIDRAPEGAARTVEEVTTEFKRRLRIHEAAIAESALRLIPEDGAILTNGRSTTVRAALRHAQRAGRRFSVICGEGRPVCEGRSLAAELAGAGIPVTIVTDAIAVALATSVQLVLVGADHLNGFSLINKAGTLGMVTVAHSARVPSYALCSSEKFLPPGYTPPAQANWPAEQVWPEAPTGVKVLNHYFDATPLNMLSGIVTNQGILPTVGIEAWLAAIKLHPNLRKN